MQSNALPNNYFEAEFDNTHVMTTLAVEDIKALSDKAMMDKALEKALEQATELCSTSCNAPMAMTMLVDEDKRWFSTCVGFQPHNV